MTGQANAQGHAAIGSLETGLLIWKGDLGKENSHLGTPSPCRNHKVELQENHKSQSIPPQQRLQGLVPVTVTCSNCTLSQPGSINTNIAQRPLTDEDAS